jgi:ethanolamine utilization protein EutN
MLLARVIGRVVATVKDEGLPAVALQWIQPLDARGALSGRPLVAADPIGAGPGEVVVYVTAREAALTLPGKAAAVDAGIVAKVDWCNLDRGRALEEH